MPKDLPSPETLRKLLRYDPETGDLFWRKRGPEWFKHEGRAESWNARNQKRYKNNTSGVTGVYWHKRLKKWQVSIKCDDGLRHIGSFECVDDAVRARKDAEKKFGCHENHGRN